MADTHTALLRFVKQTVGGNSATWGTNLNTLFDSLDDAIAGMATVSTTGGTYTLSTANNSDDEARNAILKITGTLVSNSEVVVPTSSKRYTVWNATSGSYTCTVKTSGGTGIAVTQGKVMDLFCDGTNVKAVNTELQSPTISGATLTTPTITVADNLFTIQDNSDTTKQAQFQASGITAGQTRTYTLPDASGTIALTSDITSVLSPGMVVDYAGTSAPSGYLLCYGQAVSRTTYSALYAAIGDVGGAGDGSTTFNIPDMRGRVAAGQDDMGGTSANRLTAQTGGVEGDTLGATGGAETHALTSAQLAAHTHTGPSHTHTGTTASDGAHTHTVAAGTSPGGGSGFDDVSGKATVTTSSNGAHTHSFTTDAGGTGATGSTGSGTAHNIVQPTIILNKIIKT